MNFEKVDVSEVLHLFLIIIYQTCASGGIEIKSKIQ